ncbi:MAG: Fic family protein [Saprospiraceae bacterium]
MRIPLQIIPTTLLDEYKKTFDPVIREHFDLLDESELSSPACNLSLAVAAVFSAGIEGDIIEFQEYASHRLHSINDRSGVAWKMDNIYEAYKFAQNAKLTAESLVEAHAILMKNILHEPSRGVFRTQAKQIIWSEGHSTYVAAAPNLIFSEMLKWYVDLDQILNTDLDFAEVFYYASNLHLTLCTIQPFADGNGLLARLVEKWFVAEKLGPKAWFIFSENYYFEYSSMYKILLGKVGPDYQSVDYREALFFLRMLPDALKNNM